MPSAVLFSKPIQYSLKVLSGCACVLAVSETVDKDDTSIYYTVPEGAAVIYSFLACLV